MAKKKKVNDVIPPDAPPEMAPVIDEGEEVEEWEVLDVTPPGREKLRARLEDRSVAAAESAPFRQLADGRYCETTHTREREVRIAGQRYEHVAEDDHGYWIYDRS